VEGLANKAAQLNRIGLGLAIGPARALVDCSSLAWGLSAVLNRADSREKAARKDWILWLWALGQ
jgi:hypothetical protein